MRCITLECKHQRGGYPAPTTCFGFAEHGEWFQLHDYNQREGGKPVPFGAVQLKLYAADSDRRRVLYNQPLLENPDERPAGRLASTQQILILPVYFCLQD